MSVQLVGRVSQICSRFYNEGWGWAVVDIQSIEGMPMPKTKQIKVTGTLEGFGVGYCIDVRGEAAEHPTFGMEIRAESVLEHGSPDNQGAFVVWMSSRLPNVGPVRAAQIWDTFGHDIWDILGDPEKVQEICSIPGITPERAVEAHEAYRVYRHEREVVSGLLGMGFKQAEAQVLYKRMGNAALDLAREDPYEICLRGYLPFQRVDAVVMRSAVADIGAPKRIIACAVVEARELSNSTGNTILLRDKIEQLTIEQLSLYPNIVQDVLSSAIEEGVAFVSWGKDVMLASAARDEQGIADFIKRRT
jgi:hypothetical protein